MGGIEAVQRLKEAAQEAREARVLASRLGLSGKVVSWGDLASSDIPDTEWLVDSMIPRPGLVALSGRPGSYKTFFSLWMAQRIAGGAVLFDSWLSEPYCEKPVPGKATKVLFVEEEMGLRQVKKRVADMKAMVPEGVTLAINCGLKLMNPEHVKELREFCLEGGYGCVFLDPFSTVAGLEDENDNAQAAALMDGIRAGLVEAGITVIFLHHPSKSDEGTNLRGAGDILGKCDMHLVLSKHRKEKGRIRVSYAKCRDVDEGKVSDFEMRFREEALDLGRHVFEYVGKAATEEEGGEEKLVARLTREVVAQAESPLSVEEVAKYVAERKKTYAVESALASMVDEGRATEARGRYLRKL